MYKWARFPCAPGRCRREAVFVLVAIAGRLRGVWYVGTVSGVSAAGCLLLAALSWAWPAGAGEVRGRLAPRLPVSLRPEPLCAIAGTLRGVYHVGAVSGTSERLPSLAALSWAWPAAAGLPAGSRPGPGADRRRRRGQGRHLGRLA